MLHQLITYIKWLPTTFHLHGIHSPFVFSFEKDCLKNTTKKAPDLIITNYRKALLKNNQTISVTDFGAGSRVFTSNKRKVKKIAQYAGATQQRMHLIQRIVDYFTPEHILEIGTSLDTDLTVNNDEFSNLTFDMALQPLTIDNLDFELLVSGRAIFEEEIEAYIEPLNGTILLNEVKILDNYNIQL